MTMANSKNSNRKLIIILLISIPLSIIVIKTLWIFINFILFYQLGRVFFNPEPSADNKTIPCDIKSGSQISLGSPHEWSGPPAEFTTTGGEIFITQRNFPHGDFLNPTRGSASFHIGSVTNPPTYNDQTGKVTNEITTLRVDEGAYGAVTLEPGRYWVWIATGGDVWAASCNPNGVSDPLPR